MTAQELIARARATEGQGWIYKLGAKPPPNTPPTARGTQADCTGWIWWATGRPQTARLNTAGFGPQLNSPRAGAAVWYDARPPAMYGHAGLIVRVWPDGDFDTLDCSSSDPKDRGGAIRYIKRAKAHWLRGGPVAYRWPANVTDGPSAGAVGPALGLAVALGLAFAVYRAGRAKYGQGDPTPNPFEGVPILGQQWGRIQGGR